jgi:hypothetical protein
MTYEVELTLCRTVTVTVDARSEKEAKEIARDRRRWLSSRGLRAPLLLLCATARRASAR